MISLIFLLTVLTLLVLIFRTLIKLVRRRPVRRTLAIIGLILGGYFTTWTVFKVTQKLIPVPNGTQVCFDDWCATVDSTERRADGDSIVIILHLGMFNNARSIAQTPSDPRVHILDANNRAWTFSVQRQRDYEKNSGTQPGIAHRLELHESLGTVLIFTIPKTSTDMKALIEEGPWITDLLFPLDEQVFLI